jgi:hypothetical protein
LYDEKQAESLQFFMKINAIPGMITMILSTLNQDDEKEN